MALNFFRTLVICGNITVPLENFTANIIDNTTLIPVKGK